MVWWYPHFVQTYRLWDSSVSFSYTHLENIGRYGNTSAATIPIALDEMAEQELLRPGQWIMCLGFGAGLTWGGAMFRW